jgi:hypothetical protein
MVAYALERRGLDTRTLLETPPPREEIERTLSTLDGW